jgi:hypothetical protein
MNRIDQIADLLTKTRIFTKDLLDHLAEDDWYRLPNQGVTHIAWQAAHIAMAEYRLTLQRIRGQRPEDETLVSSDFLAHFAKGSVPVADPNGQPTPQEIRETMNRVHERAMQELAVLPESVLDEKLESPHPMFDTKGGALMWSAAHEMLHAGEIALLRRLHGQAPLR